LKIVVGSDHRGFTAKEKIKKLLQSLNYEVEDCGANSNASCDYPDAAYPAALKVSEGQANAGILLCGNGLGMSIAANKVRGIRAALCHDELTAEMSRRHNDANVLCLPADLISDDLSQRIIEVWLKTPFEGGRHKRRIQKIAEFEARQRELNKPTE
jgi:ribose 5-phosphate isomerase B